MISAGEHEYFYVMSEDRIKNSTSYEGSRFFLVLRLWNILVQTLPTSKKIQTRYLSDIIESFMSCSGDCTKGIKKESSRVGLSK